MYVAVIPNRNSPPAILLREGYREGGKVKNRTLANISHWPQERIEALRHVLRGGVATAALEDAFDIERSRPHGHVAATLGTLRLLGLDEMIAAEASRHRDLCLAMICQRILQPRSKLATAQALVCDTLHSTLGEELGLGSADEDELYEAMDWIGARQEAIEDALARRHLRDGALVLYDLTSTYMEGRHCPLAALGYSRDPVRGKLQIEFGLLTTDQGCPVAVQVFEGNTGDPTTVAPQVHKLTQRFGLSRVVVVGDRGMLTTARIREDLQPAGLDWISALRSPAIASLADAGVIQLSLFDTADLAEITHPDYPGERLVVCRNPLLASERARKREALLEATEADLDQIVAATRRARRPLKAATAIAVRVGKVVNRHKVAKHFVLDIGEGSFTYTRDDMRIAQEAALDGIYVIRTSVAHLPPEQVVASYKRLAQAERAFRSFKTVDLKVRPVFHRKPERVRAHVLLCMLAYYLEWHMRRSLRPLLFDDQDPAAGDALRASPVAPAQRSPSALRKTARRRGDEGLPAQSFRSLLQDLATLTRNRIRPKIATSLAFDKLSTPTPVQQRALQLLGVSL